MRRLFRSRQVKSSHFCRFSFVAVAIVCAHPVSAPADLIVENIRFLERVSPNSGGADSQSTFFEFPPSPNAIAFSQTAMIAPSFATGNYDVQWSGDTATIDVSVSHRLSGFQGSTSSTSNIRIRPSVDSLFTVDAFFNYSHPPALLGAVDFFVTLRMNPPAPTVFSAGDSSGTIGLDPPSGTIPASGSFPLLAGNLYQISHIINTANYDPPPPGAEWLGNGEIHITINPIPEPTTLALLAPALCLFITRRTRIRARRPAGSGWCPRNSRCNCQGPVEDIRRRGQAFWPRKRNNPRMTR